MCVCTCISAWGDWSQLGLAHNIWFWCQGDQENQESCRKNVAFINQINAKCDIITEQWWCHTHINGIEIGSFTVSTQRLWHYADTYIIIYGVIVAFMTSYKHVAVYDQLISCCCWIWVLLYHYTMYLWYCCNYCWFMCLFNSCRIVRSFSWWLMMKCMYLCLHQANTSTQ